MSSFTGRRAPNVSQYLRELNTIPTTQDSTTAEDAFALDDDLAMFTNTQFFDFDSGQNTDFQPQPGKPDAVEAKTQTQTPSRSDDVTSTMGDFAGLDFMSGDFSFGDFGASYTSPTIPAFPESLGGLQPIQPNPQGVYHQQQNGYGNHHVSAAGRTVGENKPKPKSVEKTPPANITATPSTNGRPMSFDEASRLAAEEDKRRRNTAASARFRIKKKQREQALEKSAKEMTEKVTMLEGRIQQLETENKWLKNLIMEKNDGTTGSKEDMASLWKDFSSKEEAERRRRDEAKVSRSSSSSSSSKASSSAASKTDSEAGKRGK